MVNSRCRKPPEWSKAVAWKVYIRQPIEGLNSSLSANDPVQGVSNNPAEHQKYCIKHSFLAADEKKYGR